MPDFNQWLNATNIDVVDAETRAAQCWKRIQDRPTSVVLNRSTATSAANLAAQTMRIEYGEQSNFTRNDVSGATKRDVWAIGVRSHPSVADTDIQAGDRFAIGGMSYKVMDIILVPGEVQARCERQS